MVRLYAGIEAGGTKFVCGICDDRGEVIEKAQFHTEAPKETLANVIRFFKPFEFTAMGVGSFGPVCVDKAHPKYGMILNTPKLNWRNFNLYQALSSAFPSCAIKLDTDVNVAALGEQRFGAARGLTDFVYLTIGTGIGGGVLIDGKMLHGLTHPEMGHVLVRKSNKDLEEFNGICPSHKNCLEGMASGPALNMRWQVASCSVLPKDHIAWEIESDYLAQALMNYVLVLSPQKIILGGGVMKQIQLFPLIRQKLKTLLNGYVQHQNLEEYLDDFIVPSELDGDAGLKGACALAIDIQDSLANS
ncbi:ROK family protein [Fastidiosibacter lacustris]|uniref:ROK family protein n=1 Tax=Fastidiosibacter lacustris TaxID=2056695 RepID=UPI000E3449D5|nr:ROK family protein [Fastidiosibacter lacustris]